MNQNEVLQHYEFQANVGLEPNIVQRIAAQVIDMTDRAIIQECIKTASAAGITDLYLLDKQFVSEALAEKLERMKNEPLEFVALWDMYGTPVWIVWLDGQHRSKWWIVGSYEWSAMDFFGSASAKNYGKTWLAYRHQVKEEHHD